MVLFSFKLLTINILLMHNVFVFTN